MHFWWCFNPKISSAEDIGRVCRLDYCKWRLLCPYEIGNYLESFIFLLLPKIVVIYNWNSWHFSFFTRWPCFVFLSYRLKYAGWWKEVEGTQRKNSKITTKRIFSEGVIGAGGLGKLDIMVIGTIQEWPVIELGEESKTQISSVLKQVKLPNSVKNWRVLNLILYRMPKVLWE